MAAALEGEKGQCWKAWREGLQGCGDGHVHLGPVAALGSAGSWRPGAFRDAPLECAQPVCGPGGLRVPCAPVLGARSPAVGGEHQGEESGQLRPREQVRQVPRAGARTRKPTERSESVREQFRGVDCMGQRPGVGRMGVGHQKGSGRGGEKQKPQQPLQNHHLVSQLCSLCETAAAPGLYRRPVRHPASL